MQASLDKFIMNIKGKQLPELNLVHLQDPGLLLMLPPRLTRLSHQLTLANPPRMRQNLNYTRIDSSIARSLVRYVRYHNIYNNKFAKRTQRSQSLSRQKQSKKTRMQLSHESWINNRRRRARGYSQGGVRLSGCSIVPQGRPTYVTQLLFPSPLRRNFYGSL